MIDEDRTMQLFGYTSSELSPKSSKKIVAVCEGCGKHRVLIKFAYKELCSSCRAKKRCELPQPEEICESDRFIDGTYIDRILTIAEFGYDPIDLSEKSHKKVIVICKECKKQRVVSRGSYSDLCIQCAAKKRWELPVHKFVCESNRFIENTHIDRIETIKQFGYDPIDISPKSSRDVVAICKKCGKSRAVKRYNYADLCKSCSTGCKLPSPGFVEEKDRFINGTQIDRILTIDKFGYDPVDLPIKSCKDVVVVCKECGKHSIVRRRDCKKFCTSCNLLYKQNLINHDIISEDDRFIEGTGMDRIETRKEFGYDPLRLSPNSHRSVCARCQKCGKYRVVRRQAYKDLCVSCAHPIITYQQRKYISIRNQGVTEEEWTGFSTKHDWRTWGNVTFLNEPFEGCHRHHITKTLVVCIPSELHNHIPHNLKTGLNMGEINMLALQFISGEW